MNANELADRLVDYHDSFLAKDCATMLRQQQAEIEALKAHPVKELTDDEIWKCHDETDSDNWVIDFARAILRKAQEK